MASAHQIREVITETTTGSARPRVPREVRDEVCRYAVHRREGEAVVLNVADMRLLRTSSVDTWLGHRSFVVSFSRTVVRWRPVGLGIGGRIAAVSWARRLGSVSYPKR